MTELLDPLTSGDRFVLLLVSVVMITTMLVPIVVTGFWQWRKVREREASTALVHDMLARGFSSDEIERVLAGADVAAPSANISIGGSQATFSAKS